MLHELGEARAVPRLPPATRKTALLVVDVQYYCADVGGGGMHDAAHADEDGTAGAAFSFARRIKETMVPNIARLLRRSRALGAWRRRKRKDTLRAVLLYRSTTDTHVRTQAWRRSLRGSKT